MPSEKSIQTVKELTELFSSSELVVAAEYAGLNVTQMNGLRAAIKQNDGNFRIAKNTLARIAADQAGKPQLKEVIDGPIGFLTSEGDPATAAKSVVSYASENRLEINMTGGMLGGAALSSERVVELANLPSREQLLAMVFAQMNAPVTGLVNVLAGTIRGLVTVLQRRAEQLGEPEPEPEPAATA
jgi:large subunit ribosomal protein L10